MQVRCLTTVICAFFKFVALFLARKFSTLCWFAILNAAIMVFSVSDRLCLILICFRLPLQLLVALQIVTHFGCVDLKFIFAYFLENARIFLIFF